MSWYKTIIQIFIKNLLVKLESDVFSIVVEIKIKNQNQ